MCVSLYCITATQNRTTVKPTTLWSLTLFTNSTQQRVNYCEKPLDASVENVAYAIFMMVLLLASFVGNSFVILATILSKQLRKESDSLLDRLGLGMFY